MSLNVEEIASGMIGAAKGVVGERWPATQKYFESESRMFAERLASIAAMHAEGLISEGRARLHVEFQTEAWETTLLAVQGLNQLMIEEALNAAIKVIRDAVNTSVKFVLL
ncbi:MAG TPA: hypothetical protein VLI06_17475 [Solimonas sp.]|nr:hypothetical protein [Solimonas sp.]